MQTNMIPTVEMVPGGPAFSRLAYGTWRLLDDAAAATPAAVAARLEACADVGMTTVDTAEIYGAYEVEERLGAALRVRPGLRQRLQLVTKCGIYIPNARHPERQVAHYNATTERIIKSAEKSLRLLATDHLDLLLVHRPDWLTPADETAAALERLISDGKIRAAGVSNYTVGQLETLRSRMTHPLVTNQIELSLFHMDPITDGTLDQCQRLRMKPMAWSPLGGGRLFREGDEASVRIRAACATIAAQHGAAELTAEALAVAWILALPASPVVVIGTNKLERIQRIAAAASLQLTREDWYRLWQAAQGRGLP